MYYLDFREFEKTFQHVNINFSSEAVKNDIFAIANYHRVIRISGSDKNFRLSCRGTQTPRDCCPGINKLRRVSA